MRATKAFRRTYKVEITHMMRLSTLYAGKSRDRAEEVADAARTALVIGDGTAEITLRENDTADLVWSVTEGDASLSLIGGAADAKKNQIKTLDAINC